ncbi:hypothetical protein EXIGLDRAFT_696525 [Exidia glandulosa HHB12029]|uniref:Uncharacterized protein n=1 Tax=Exidia glandulosa HHB12029 TaxID=1314781 RepID=A0A165FA63_EXIGL|nr:hypothetical protein EXIGLDRAFT_696525 [Exidia glandulosa HHB12029]
MSDFLRTDGRISRTLPNAYSELMLPVCGGHALWFPRKAELGGGALGDIGYIDDGAFEKKKEYTARYKILQNSRFLPTFNVYESLPGDLPLLPRPVSGMTLDEQFNMPSMQTSRRSQIELRVNGSGIVAPLPLNVSPMTIEPRIALQEERFAFLIPPQPIRKDHLSLDHRDELKLWLTVNRRHLREGSVIITKVVRSSGWLGGVATGRKVEASATLGANAPAIGRVEFGASHIYETTQLADIKGPDDWTSTAGAGYVLVINFVMARGRFGQLRDRFKFAASSSSASRPTWWSAAQSPATDQTPASRSSHDPETEPRDDTVSPSESASSDSSDEGDSILLATILDHVLATNPNVDVAVADSSIIPEFIQVHKETPSPAEVETVMVLREVQSEHDGSPSPRTISALAIAIGRLRAQYVHRPSIPMVIFGDTCETNTHPA